MEAKEEFIVTEKWLEEMKACEDGLRAFKKHFPNGGEALEVLKRCEELGYEELDYRYFGEWLVDCLPPIYPPLELNNLIGNLFYPNDVHIKGDVSTQGCIYIKGSLKVDGKLTANENCEVYADFVNADEIDISGDTYIPARIKANSIIMSDGAFISGDTVANRINLRDAATIFGNTKAKIINFKGGYIGRNVDVDADEIINDGGTIWGNVKTIKIKKINGGTVDGKITYKRSDEHK